MKKYLEPEELAEVKKLDLLTYLYNYEPNELVKNGPEVRSVSWVSRLHLVCPCWQWFTRLVVFPVAISIRRLRWVCSWRDE